jgi:acetyltransferase-like isoleucine patch superfamily enzyme
MILENNNFIHEDVYIKDDSYTIGSNNAIDKGFYCTTRLQIGSYVHISPYVTSIGGLTTTLEIHGVNNIMAGARLICGSDRFDGSGLFGAMIPDDLKGRQVMAPVVLEKFSNVGTNAVVLPGSILREGVLLGAGSLLMGDTVPWGVYKGNPAKLVKIIDATESLRRYELLTARTE